MDYSGCASVYRPQTAETVAQSLVSQSQFGARKIRMLTLITVNNKNKMSACLIIVWSLFADFCGMSRAC